MSLEAVLGFFFGVGLVAYGWRMRNLGIARTRREDIIRKKIVDLEEIEFIGLSQEESNSGDIVVGSVFVFIGILILAASFLS